MGQSWEDGELQTEKKLIDTLAFVSQEWIDWVLRVTKKRVGFTNKKIVISPTNDWLVVSAPLKNISQWERLSHILWKIKHVPNHQPDCQSPWKSICFYRLDSPGDSCTNGATLFSIFGGSTG